MASLLLLAAGYGSYVLGPYTDRVTAGIGTLIFVFIAALIMLIWWTLYSGFTIIARWVPITLMVLGGAAFFATYEIAYVSGLLLPSVRRRGEVAPDQRLKPLSNKKNNSDSPGVVTLTATENDFPQFLGPQRNLRIEGVRLNRDWEKNPPQLVWRRKIGAGLSAFSAVNGYAVTQEQRGEEELVTCYDIGAGEIQWAQSVKARHSTTLGRIGPRATPTVYQGKVYALGATGWLHCLDGKNGSVVWQRNLLEEFGIASPEADKQGVGWGRSGSPLIVDNLVVVPAGGPAGGPYLSLVAYDKDTGEQVWTGGKSQISFSSPNLATFHGLRQIVIVNESNVAGYRIETGEELWSHSWNGSSTSSANTSQAVPLSGDRIWVSKGYFQGAAVFQISTKNEQWRADQVWAKSSLMKTKFTNIAVKDGHAYGLSDGILECVRIDDGRRQWKRGRYNYGQVLLIGDVLLVISEDGELIMVEATPKGHRELGRFQVLQGQTWNNLCFYNPYLLVRNSEQAACYQLSLDD